MFIGDAKKFNKFIVICSCFHLMLLFFLGCVLNFLLFWFTSTHNDKIKLPIDSACDTVLNQMNLKQNNSLICKC